MIEHHQITSANVAPATSATSLPSPAPIGRMLYSRKEAARQLSLSLRAVDNLIARKALNTRRIGKRVLIPHAELVRFSRQNHPEAIN
jgi:excisionase family DNA binding protein